MQAYMSPAYMQCNVCVMCRTAEAFTRRLGVLGVNLQAERMLHAFVSRGLELRLQDIKYHAQGQHHEVESLTGISSKGSDAEASHNPQSLMKYIQHAMAPVFGNRLKLVCMHSKLV